MFFLWQSFISAYFFELCNRRRMVFCDGFTHHVYYLRNEYERYGQEVRLIEPILDVKIAAGFSST